MPNVFKTVVSCFLFVALVFYSCSNSNNSTVASVNKDSLIHTVKIDSTKLKKKIEFRKLFGTWIQYDTLYKGKYTDVKPLFKDTTRLLNKIEYYRKHGGCDGGCVFASKFTRDGFLFKRMDDVGESYTIKIDSDKNIVTCLTHMFKGAKAPADTMWTIEITYLDDKFLLEYYIDKSGKPGRTEMFKRTYWNFQ